MNLNMTGHHLEITPSIRDYVSSKMTRINRHFDHVIDVSMILSVEKLRQKIEANVHLSGKDIFAECEDSDMYAAIDLLVDQVLTWCTLGMEHEAFDLALAHGCRDRKSVV